MKPLTIVSAAAAIALSGCASLGEPTDKSPKQLQAERDARLAERPGVINARVAEAAREMDADAILSGLGDGQPGWEE